ncbi:MAG TPA: MFS transporter [Thermomicrobiales bacterium]|nr:MFS transporter [Thermomicrobiales bacterium]
MGERTYALGIRGLLANKALLVFMLGHFTVDMYGGILPIMFPSFADTFDLSNRAVGMISLSFTAAASLSQPLFGYVADRWGSRYLAVGSMAWSAVMVGLIGLAPSFPAVITLAILAGLGSGAYHPQGASNAAAVVSDTNRNSALAFYTVGGTSGYALGPIIGAAALFFFGRGGTIVVLPFGVIVAFALYRQFVRFNLGLPQRQTAAEIAARGAINWAPLLIVISVVMLRSWVHSSVVSFVPLWFDELGYSSGFYSVLQTLILGAGAAGTLLGGALADRHGQRRVLVLSLIGAAPLLVLFGALPGIQSVLLGPAFTFVADMSLSITLVLAQRFLPGRVGMASGFILGIGFVTGGIGVPVTGAFADAYGFSTAMMASSLILLIAAAVGTRIPGREATVSLAR